MLPLTELLGPGAVIMRTKARQACIALFSTASLSACATLHQAGDPRHGAPVAEVMKSLRCELVTFIELNRQRQLAFARLYGTDFQTAREKYAYLELHELFAAGVYVNFEVLGAAAIAGAVDRQIPF